MAIGRVSPKLEKGCGLCMHDVLSGCGVGSLFCHSGFSLFFFFFFFFWRWVYGTLV